MVAKDLLATHKGILKVAKGKTLEIKEVSLKTPQGYLKVDFMQLFYSKASVDKNLRETLA